MRRWPKARRCRVRLQAPAMLSLRTTSAGNPATARSTNTVGTELSSKGLSGAAVRPAGAIITPSTRVEIISSTYARSLAMLSSVLPRMTWRPPVLATSSTPRRDRGVEAVDDLWDEQRDQTRALGLQSPGHSVRHVPQRIGGREHLLPTGGTDVAATGNRPRNRRRRNPGPPRNILDRRQGNSMWKRLHKLYPHHIGSSTRCWRPAEASGKTGIGP